MGPTSRLTAQTALSDVLAGLAHDVWPVQAQDLQLAESDDTAIAIWSWRIDIDPSRVKSESECLSPEERERMARLRTPELKSRFQAAHGRMRRILGAYAGIPASDLRLIGGPFGKPSIAPGDRPVPHFNLSHSDGFAALAVSSTRPVGIDIERIRPIELCVSREMFSPAELAALEELPPDERLRGFYRCWTRKEAIVKGLGSGLSVPLNSFDVSLRPDRPAEVVRADTFPASDWRLFDFAPAPDFAGAVAVASHVG